MPKEVIQHPKSHDENAFDASGQITGVHVWVDPELILHWSALKSTELDLCGGVQLSIAEYPVTPKEDWDSAQSWPPAPNREIYTANLDREACNKLIRLLRRARDQAYGRDE